MPEATSAPTPVHLGAVLDGLAKNPALPPETFHRLFARTGGHGEIAKRPDLTDDMTDTIIAADDFWHTHALALNRTLPHRYRLVLAGHPDSGIRTALAIAATDAPRELFERLLTDPDPRVRVHLAQNDDVPRDLRARQASDPEPEVRATLAQWWPEAPEPVRRLLLTDPDDSVRAAACSTYYRRLPHPVPPADLVPGLLADPVTRAGAVRHGVLDAETASRLAGDPDENVRKELAAHPQLPSPVRGMLAEDPSSLVRVRVFARQDTPQPDRAAIHARITADDHGVERLFDHDQDLDDDALDREITDHLARAELRSLRLPWVKADPLPYVDSPYACFRASAAMSDRLPEEAVTRLLHDEESDVRTTMALHARDRIDPETAERIDRSHRPAKRMAWRPADDFPLPAAVLRRLATDPDPRMRQLATRDPELPVELLRALAADSDPAVRRTVASHSGVPLPELIRLLADPSERVATAAAGNPVLPPGEMHRLLTLAGL
ncbi:hypothetical protein [Streptomyces sp. NBC_00102]|uniref:hypothetical protein n=1 Tax=Streptomyces sp. NBC_00102 TaxID=2975652 RepID=UPI0022566CED|nr:hypothetical protein [Streptomyces sp. NBC_00102]MCX5401237.1 hypothetical protein [Streptomyces sp. NBC_00102]